MKKSAVLLAAVAAIVVIAWVLALITVLLMRWAGVWSMTLAAVADESILVVAAVLAVFVAECLAVFAALVYTVTRFPETIGAAVDVFSAARGRVQPRKTRRPTH